MRRPVSDAASFPGATQGDFQTRSAQADFETRSAQADFPAWSAQADFPAWSIEAARSVVAPFAAVRGGLIPALHALQAAFGHIDDAAFPLLADVFNLSRADVFGVVTFYRDFRREAPPRRVVKLCRADACRARGGEALAERAAKTAPDGVGVEAVYCLGLCAVGPAALADGELHARLTPERLDQLLGMEGAP